MMEVGIEAVCVYGLAGAFSDCTEGLFAKAGELPHRVRYAIYRG